MSRRTVALALVLAAGAATVFALPALAARARSMQAVATPPGGDPNNTGAPRSVRNRNPGNIIKTATKWQGEVEGSDPSFETFSSADYGARAMLINMRTQRERGANTIAKMIAIWSATDVPFYIAFVTQKAQIGADVGMNWTNPNWAKVAWAMAAFEAGGEYYPLSLFEKWWKASQR